MNAPLSAAMSMRVLWEISQTVLYSGLRSSGISSMCWRITKERSVRVKWYYNYTESALTRHGGKICMSGRNSKRNTVKIIVMKTYHQNLQHWTLNRKINSEFSPTFNNFLSRWQQLTDHRDPFVLLKTYILTFLIRIKIKSTWMEPLAATSLFFNVSFHKSLSVKSFSRWWFTIYKWKTFTCMR